MNRILAYFSVATLTLAVCAPRACAEHWPQWRGPRNDSISTKRGIPDGWSKTTHVAWRTPLPGRAGATPCVWGNRIFLTSNEGDDLVLLCVNTRDGGILWKQRVTSGNQDARAKDIRKRLARSKGHRKSADSQTREDVRCRDRE